MSWEKRGNNTYYYSAEKVNGRTVKTYISNRRGTADVIAKLDRLDRDRREAVTMLHQLDKEEADELTGKVQAFCIVVESIAKDALTQAGYHRRNRGPWRRKRISSSSDSSERELMPAKQAKKKAEEPEPFVVPEDANERLKIVNAAMQSKTVDKDTAKALLCLRKYPGEMCIEIHDSLPALFEAVSGGRPVYKEVLLQTAEEHRKKLKAGRNVSPLEALLIERVVVCMMHLSTTERTYHNAFSEGKTMRIEKAAFYEKQIERANRQYLAAIKTLAQVRKLELPTLNVALPGSLQMNVGEKQVNLAQAGAAQVNAG